MGLGKTSSLFERHDVGTPGGSDVVFAPKMHQARNFILT